MEVFQRFSSMSQVVRAIKRKDRGPAGLGLRLDWAPDLCSSFSFLLGLILAVCFLASQSAFPPLVFASARFLSTNLPYISLSLLDCQ